MNQPPSQNAPALPSAMPKTHAVQQGDAWLLRERQSPTCMFIFLLIITVFWNAVTFPVAGMFLFGAFSLGPQSPVSWFALLPLVFVVVGIILIVVTIRMGLVVFAFGPSELLIERLPLRLGESVGVRFRKRMRGGMHLNALRARLVCREWVRYRAGTDTRTMTHTIWSEELPVSLAAVVSPTGDIDAGWNLTIPMGLPPSFAAPDNALEWQIEVTVDVARMPDPDIVFLLAVLPEIAR